jgi:hypothetical protein
MPHLTNRLQWYEMERYLPIPLPYTNKRKHNLWLCKRWACIAFSISEPTPERPMRNVLTPPNLRELKFSWW